MSYYMQGDYYGVGDPGLFDVFKKVAGTVGKVALGVGKAAVAASPVGRAVSAITGTLMGPQAIPAAAPVPSMAITPPVMPTIPMAGALPALPTQLGPTGQQLMVTGRAQNVIIGGKRFHYNKYGELKRGRIPVMNPLNPRALSRSSRRIESCRTRMTKALKHTGYKIVPRSSGRGRGSRGVITRSEAARALRA